MTEKLSLTGEDRVLLYLLNFGSLDNVCECDSGLTQKGIAVNVRIQRKHISRHLEKLLGHNLIEEYARHVKGSRQRMKCYGLTSQGLARAKNIEETVGKVVVKVRMDGKTSDMKIADIDGATSVHLRLSDIVCEALEAGGALDMAVLETIEERNRLMMDEKTMKTEVYRQALAVAWRDGILTSSEKHLVDALRNHLGVSDEDHRSLEGVVMSDAPMISSAYADIYDEILSLVAGHPTEREEDILEMLRERLKNSR
ncbi:MAG: hypothetical protein R6W91_01750 [Thermoplasmata archaeon]